jgi:hypothetical protein
MTRPSSSKVVCRSVLTTKINKELMSARAWYEYDDQEHEDGMSDGDGLDESNCHKNDEENEIAVAVEDQWTMR